MFAKDCIFCKANENAATNVRTILESYYNMYVELVNCTRTCSKGITTLIKKMTLLIFCRSPPRIALVYWHALALTANDLYFDKIKDRIKTKMVGSKACTRAKQVLLIKSNLTDIPLSLWQNEISRSVPKIVDSVNRNFC